MKAEARANAAATEVRSDVIADAIYQEYLAALLDGARLPCGAIVQHLLAAGADPKDLYVRLFQRSLDQVGELWERGRISVAIEHLATAITTRVLALVQSQVMGQKAGDRSIVVACVANEPHQVGAHMAADYCELLGWRSYFLGANTPLPDLLELVEERRPTALGLSVTLRSNLPALREILDALRGSARDLPVLVGGGAFRRGSLAALDDYPHVACVASLDDLGRWIGAHDA